MRFTTKFSTTPLNIHSIAALAPDLLTVTFNGLSKTYRVAGFRQGWMVVLNGPKKHAKGYIKGMEMLASMCRCRMRSRPPSVVIIA